MSTIYLFFIFIHILLNVQESLGGHRGHGRTQYHEQGVHSPYSYRFGFDTGDPYNPLTRHEVSHGPGHVKGHYSFKDQSGKLQVVHYEAHPKHGFRAYPKHHG